MIGRIYGYRDSNRIKTLVKLKKSEYSIVLVIVDVDDALRNLKRNTLFRNISKRVKARLSTRVVVFAHYFVDFEKESKILADSVEECITNSGQVWQSNRTLNVTSIVR